MEITQEKLNAWYEHKSNKEAFLEQLELIEDDNEEEETF